MGCCVCSAVNALWWLSYGVEFSAEVQLSGRYFPNEVEQSILRGALDAIVKLRQSGREDYKAW